MSNLPQPHTDGPFIVRDAKVYPYLPPACANGTCDHGPRPCTAYRSAKCQSGECTHAARSLVCGVAYPDAEPPAHKPAPEAAAYRAQRVPEAYEAVRRAKALIMQAFEEEDEDEFLRSLADYTRTVLDGVRAVQAPMWGPSYVMDPAQFAPDSFTDASISWAGRVEYAKRKMAAAAAELSKRNRR